ncbi:AAA family ATPase [Amycolatopsis sp. cg9]|uniref:AAA family ATPase n=1 Tax=Amycolatopsis sp. cg9 TaxID=3238801 RepID=UPI00352378DE
MALTAIECRGYKAFDQHVRVELRRLTVLFGKNNSGKTSLARLPIFALASLSSAEMFRLRTPVLSFGNSFLDVASASQAHPSIMLGVEFGSSALRVELQRIVGYSGQEMVAPVFVDVDDGALIFESSRRLAESHESWKKIMGERGGERYAALRARQAELAQISDQVMHIPGARPAIHATYQMRAPNSPSVFEVPYVLASSATVRDTVEDWFAKNLDGTRIMIDRAGFAFRFLVDTGNGAVNLAHAGRGTQSALTMVANMAVAAIDSGGTSLVVVEEPEEHLHPSAHGGLADLAIGTSEKARVVVETHSENFILRIRRRIAEGLISPSDVGIYFVDSDHSVNEVAIDRQGIARNWPAGIFEDDIEEAEAIVTSRLSASGEME